MINVTIRKGVEAELYEIHKELMELNENLLLQNNSIKWATKELKELTPEFMHIPIDIIMSNIKSNFLPSTASERMSSLREASGTEDVSRLTQPNLGLGGETATVPPKGVEHVCAGEERGYDECTACAVEDCPHKEPLHYHHDGCPACYSENLKFETLGEKERLLLLKALDIDVDGLHCQFCEELVNYKDCCIFPALRTTMLASILCNSPLCMVEYLEEENSHICCWNAYNGEGKLICSTCQRLKK